MLMLAMHPDYQERVHEECKLVLSSDAADITLESLSRLTYLDQFIKESMRMFPSVPYLTRTTTDFVQVGACSTLTANYPAGVMECNRPPNI